MHPRNSEFQIGEESIGISSDSDSIPSLSFSPNIQLPTQLHPPISTSFQPDPHTRLSIQIHNLSSPPHSSPNPPSPITQQNCTVSLSNHERFSNNPSASQSPVSSPHKRPMMTKSSSAVSATLSPPRRNQEPSFHTVSLSPSYRCCGSFTTSFGTPSLSSLKHSSHLRCARLLQPHFRYLIVLSLPSFYFLVSNPRRSFIIDLLSVIAFSAALLISLKLALPRLPSIRLFLARSLPIKLNSPSPNHPQPVLWSIGSKPKSEKSPTSGFSVQIYSNGDIYEGEFHKGKCSGSGVYHYHLSGRYEGDWVDGKYDGYGVETWAKGSRYRGQYRQGLRDGIGIYRFYTGDVYAGEWSNGQCHGCGVHTCQDGSQYIGEFKWGVKHGLGHYHFRNGDMYAGEYFANKMHGFGVYQFQNGHRYEGAWHEGRRQGLGMYSFRNGETQSGHWQNGILDDPKTHTAVGHAKVFNAAQDARCAAEKAYSVAKVDEGVNKCIARANRAANAARVAAVKAVQNRMQQNDNDKQ